MKNVNQYQALAELFKYPESDAPQLVQACQDLLDKHYPEAGSMLKMFSEKYAELNSDAREELYTKTFDVQPICYLDFGYVIFGEDYKRGSFLLHMQQEQRKINRECSPELPDNMYHMLNLLPVHPDRAFVNELVAKIVVPGVKIMIREFEGTKVQLKIKVLKKLHNTLIQEELNIGNIYQFAFFALLKVLESDFVQAIEQYNPEEENLASQAFFEKKNNSKNQLVNNFQTN